MASKDTDGTIDEDVARHSSHIQIVARNQSFRRLSRSPHPYRRRRTEQQLGSETASSEYSSRWVRSRKASSDSGTDADDEGNGILKGLPAPLPKRDTLTPGEDEDSGVSERLKGRGKGRRRRSESSGRSSS
ncbi:predicted protein [Uncinocarpus reesii 1704]|uniref:Uncharacterized protein n=1 Tax=Uncinocarpus reesii (strain UAMH 1704) TaxID=336963 RepID=C4JG66_UNCRE|nr:uncharacterized protein UREG_02464 [Uncinocarpus reesii 1704]EEP77615.1 predicted protein [Uncinocarpus reesii 1704]